MSRIRKGFLSWFAVLMAFFVFANLAGLVRPRRLLSVCDTGFPLTIAVWGFGVREFFDWLALAVNLGLAIVVSAGIAAVCAWARSNTIRRSRQEDAEVVTVDRVSDRAAANQRKRRGKDQRQSIPRISWRTVASFASFTLAVAYAGALTTANSAELRARRHGHFMWDSGLIECGMIPIVPLIFLGLVCGIGALRTEVKYRWPAIVAVVLNIAPICCVCARFIWIVIWQKLRSVGW